MTRPVVLVILDGVGWGRRDDGDAVWLARTPNLDRLLARQPWCLLQAHGTAVGLPTEADMGNSEVGHNAMGAGRVFDQGSKLVDQAIASGAMWRSEAWKRAVRGRTLHLLGLVSDGNVHSSITHLHALIERAAEDGVKRLRLHALTDGRDVEARSALAWIEPLEACLARHRQKRRDFAIASGGGRMHITMDRYEADWPMVERGWRCHVQGEGRRFPSASQAIRTFYQEDPDLDDQWLPAFVVGDYDGMHDGDAVLCFNFRGDRAIEISRAFDDGPDFDRRCFDRSRRPDVFYAGMMEYDGDLHIPKHYLVAPPAIDRTVGEFLGEAGLSVLALSETQKFGHVTYFFNGNRSDPLPGEERIEVPSAPGPFDRIPEMRAVEVADRAVEAIRSGRYDQIRLNFANGDMVGHTANLQATVEAMEVIDRCLGRLVDAVDERGGILLITADHGNADEMFRVKGGRYQLDGNGQRIPSPSHSKNPVPFILYDPSGHWTLDKPWKDDGIAGGIAQVGATLLALADLPVPDFYLPALVHPAPHLAHP